MNTNYGDEDTKFANEEEKTTIQDPTENSDSTEESPQPENPAKPDGKSKWKKGAAGAGIGVALGGVAAMTMGMQSADSGADPIGPTPDADPADPWWSDGELRVATNVNDNMTFDEAFAAAREEVGPGGAFEWNGSVHNTYTAAEWAALSPSEQHAFNDHFTWNHGSGTHSSGHNGHSYANHQQTEPNDINVVPADNPDNNTASTDTPTGGDDDINVISVDHPGDNNLTAEAQILEAGGDDITATAGDDLLVTPAEPDIEILGVVHDAEAGTNIGGMLVDGQEVVVVDLDGDMTFDVMASDINHNGELDNNEVVDIHEQGLTVADMGGFTNPTDDLMAANDVPDYSSDPIYEG